MPRSTAAATTKGRHLATTQLDPAVTSSLPVQLYISHIVHQYTHNMTTTAPISSSSEELVRASAKRTREIFAADFASSSALEHALNPAFSITATTPAPSTAAAQVNVAARIRNEYEHVRELPPALAAKMAAAASTAAERRKKIKSQNAEEQASDPKMRKMIAGASEKADKAKDAQSMALTLGAGGKGTAPNANGPTPERNATSSSLVRKDTVRQTKPEWHQPWKISRVMAGHMGWVRSLAVDPDNRFFASGAADRTSKSIFARVRGLSANALPSQALGSCKWTA